ncbi:uncharacterized protein LOC130668725 [Microplitis mediator]|uniref:uncharacterized protein LOC130668725 n=1 Tax=Microplitis mediator TaxID=375433 RepID=UPI002552F2F6|nr:uncharacterized protein LOC130668725 [Microplitis mediator]
MEICELNTQQSENLTVPLVPSTPNQTPSDVPSSENSNFIQTKLTEWDLAEYINVFEREKINKSVFLQMPEEGLKQLINPLGDRFQFILRRTEYLSACSRVDPAPKALYTPGKRLRELLRSTFQGQYILRQRNLLSCGNNLASIIIDFILSKNDKLKIRREQYEFWASEIVAVWQTEDVSTWYRHRSTTNATSGKLVCRFTNLSKKIKSEVLKFAEEHKQPEGGEVDETVKLYIDELAQTTADDTARILFLWENTFKYRRNNSESISDYFNNFKQLRSPMVVQLLELDFNLLRIAEKNALEEKWPTLHVKILKIAKIKKAATQFLNDSKNVPQDVLAWRVFSYLFRPIVMSTGAKKTWKPSALEQANGFITWISDISQLENAINVQKSLCESKKFTLQPFIVAVGRLQQIKAAYVIIDSERIKFPTVTQAVAFCWKAIYALNAKYYLCCAAVWIFIQQEIYGCKELQHKYQSVQWVINALKNVTDEESVISSESSNEDEN